MPAPAPPPRAPLKIVLLEGLHRRAIDALRADPGHDVHALPQAASGEALVEILTGAHAVGIRSRTQLSADVLQSLPQLLAVGCFCIGTNQVDLRAARRLGIPVFNAPFSNTRSVAELVLAECILLMRGIPAKNAALHRGEWMKSAADSFEVRGKTFGIVGYGHIGTQAGVLAEQLGMDVVVHDIEPRLMLGNARQLGSLRELLGAADVVTLHVPQTPQTEGLIGAAELAAMKPGSHLINASRGNVVDIGALADALRRRHLHGAAIDVFPVEPKGNDAGFASPLQGLDNVLLTPHIGGSTMEAQANIGSEVAAKLMRFLHNGSTVSAVNFPQVALPEHAGRHRLLHIHRNEPGLIAGVNDRLSEAGVNVAAQHLGTQGDIGYVVIDVDPGAEPGALEKLCAVPGTIRCRLLY